MDRFYSCAGLRVTQGHWPAAAGQTTEMPRPIAVGDYDKAAVQVALHYERFLSVQATLIPPAGGLRPKAALQSMGLTRMVCGLISAARSFSRDRESKKNGFSE